MLRALGPGFWQDPWNPYVIVLPTALLVFLVWSLCLGERWAWPLALGVASFDVQTHIGTALPIVAMLTYAGWRFVVARRRRMLSVDDDDVDRGRRQVAFASLAVVGVLWLPPVIDVAIHGGGNAAVLIDFFTRNPSSQRFSTAWHAIAAQLDLQPEWLVGPSQATLISGGRLSSGDVPLLLIAVVPLMWSAARRHDHEIIELGGVVGLGMVVSVIATKAIIGIPYAYLVHWTWSAGLVFGILLVWGGFRALPSARTAVIGLALGTIVVASSLNVTAAIHQPGPQADSQAAVRTLTRETIRAVPRGTTVLLRSSPGTFQPSLVLALTRAGLNVRVPRSEAFGFPSRFVQRSEQPTRELLVIIGTPERVRSEIARQRGRVVASWHGAPPEEIRRGLAAGGELLADHQRGPDSRADMRKLRHELRSFAAAVMSLKR